MKKIIAVILLGMCAAAIASAMVLTKIDDPNLQKHVGKKITFVPKKVKSKNKGEGDTMSFTVDENGVPFVSGTVSPPPIPPPNPPFVNTVDLKPGTRTDVGQNPHVGPWLHITCPAKEADKAGKFKPEPHLQIYGVGGGVGTLEIEISEAEQKEILKFLKDNFK